MSILILTRPDQHVGAYGNYLVEILRCEGLVDHVVRTDLPADPGAYDAYDAVVVTRMRLPKASVDALGAYVERGGRLVVLRPSYLLATRLGLEPTSTMVSPAYVRPSADGVPAESIQAHVVADGYTPGTGEELARLYADHDVETSFPAVLDIPVGDGRAVVFSYDLAEAVALLRQGDPRRVGGRSIGYGEPYRIFDLVAGHADPRCWHLPQADIHAMLLGNAINLVARSPQPRVWYYDRPETASVLVLDSDDDWSSREHFDALLSAVERHEGHITVYLMMDPTRQTIATPELVTQWRQRGHSFGIHHNGFDPDLDGEDAEEVLPGIVRRDLAAFEKTYGGSITTNRNHCCGWVGYAELPKLYAASGVDMDLNSVDFGAAWLTYLYGSARPMRFVDLDGTVIDCFQQATQAYDDMSVQSLLSSDPAGQAALTRALMVEKTERYYSPLSMLSHPVSFFSYSSEYMNRCWSAARELGMPIWSAFEWAAFVRARDRTQIRDCSWEGGRFTCRIAGSSPTGMLTLTLPVAAERVLEATVNGKPVDVTGRDVFGWPTCLLGVELSADIPEAEIRVLSEPE
jgi:hypothetical protein